MNFARDISAARRRKKLHARLQTQRDAPLRLAFVDLLFSWPPHGGADVDLYRTMSGLQDRGHQVHLFGAAYERSWERGKFDPETLPFPAARLDFSLWEFNRRTVPRRIRAAVDEWQPDVAVVCDGFFLKPYVIEALARYPLIGRYYAYEMACPRDMLLLKDGAPCPNAYPRTPRICNRCALAGLRDDILRWQFRAWTHEYLVSGAFLPSYHKRLAESTRQLDAVIVSNEIMRRHFANLNTHVYIFPGGVDVAAFPHEPAEPKPRKVILMAGRVEDPVKGLSVLAEAGKRLAARDDFEIRVTYAGHEHDAPWFKAIGWQDRDGLLACHRDADICVVPSIWEEPFGLAALEAMAAARPVCASRVGGLQSIVRHGETGLLFDRGDSRQLADCLAQLLDDADLRRRMGDAGRRVAELEYDWKRVIERNWPPLLDEVMA